MGVEGQFRSDALLWTKERYVVITLCLSAVDHFASKSSSYDQRYLMTHLGFLYLDGLRTVSYAPFTFSTVFPKTSWAYTHHKLRRFGSYQG